MLCPLGLVPLLSLSSLPSLTASVCQLYHHSSTALLESEPSPSPLPLLALHHTTLRSAYVHSHLRPLLLLLSFQLFIFFCFLPLLAPYFSGQVKTLTLKLSSSLVSSSSGRKTSHFFFPFSASLFIFFLYFFLKQIFWILLRVDLTKHILYFSPFSV